MKNYFYLFWCDSTRQKLSAGTLDYTTIYYKKDWNFKYSFSDTSETNASNLILTR